MASCYILETLSIVLVTTDVTLELMLIDIRILQGSLLLGLLYRLPSTPAAAIGDLDDALASISPTKLKSAVLLGDFNVDLLNLNHHLCAPLNDLFTKYNFTQVVTSPTRTINNSGSLIDHVYVSDITLLRVSQPLDSSDHNTVIITLSRVRRTVWHYSRAEFVSACDELFPSLPAIDDTDDVNSAWLRWKHTFLSLMEKFIPHRKVIIRKSTLDD